MSSPSDVWSASDYAPTAARLRPVSVLVATELARRLPTPATVVDIGSGHGDGVTALVAEGYTVTAIEPTARIREVGKQNVPNAAWRDALGEATGLDDSSVDAVTSTFGSMFCDPITGPAEWARILRPGGELVMTAWNQKGFLATMTDAMMESVNPGGSKQTPPHMAWGITEVAHERLSQWFENIRAGLDIREYRGRHAALPRGQPHARMDGQQCRFPPRGSLGRLARPPQGSYGFLRTDRIHNRLRTHHSATTLTSGTLVDLARRV